MVIGKLLITAFS